MKKVYASVFGSGLGHISRVKSIASSLEAEKGTEFLYSTFDEAFDFLRKINANVIHSPSVGVEWNMAGGFSGKDTIVRFPLYMLRFARQVAFESDQISRFNPRVVLSDSRLSTIFAAKAKLFPIVTILNQFKVLFPPRFRTNSISLFYERFAGDVLGLFWTLSDSVLFPDLPPPFTLGEANIAGTDVSNSVRYTGFMTPKIVTSPERIQAVRNALSIDDRPIVFIQISGPEPTKPHFIRTAIDSTDILSRYFNVVVSKGHPQGKEVPYRLGNGAWVYEWCPIKDELFVMSDVIVARGGHVTLSQCIEHAKPAVVVPIYNHSEQIYNADRFVELNMGISIHSEELSVKTLVNAVEQCLTNSKFKKSAESLKRISDKYDGIATAADALSEFL
jgi:UDP-N-acetylglucosamine--N-acetylmuramyl-(pentapeptide) pyrophosphoryl-undecaprenol N-acetylglucosamine transferase